MKYKDPEMNALKNILKKDMYVCVCVRNEGEATKETFELLLS